MSMTLITPHCGEFQLTDAPPNFSDEKLEEGLVELFDMADDESKTGHFVFYLKGGGKLLMATALLRQSVLLMGDKNEGGE